MKKSDFYHIEEGYIILHESNHKLCTSDIKKVDVSILPVQKNAGEEIMNAAVNALSSSLGNANEKVNIYVEIIHGNNIDKIKVNTNPLIRNNLDCHEMVTHARNLQAAIKKDCNL